ncbi:hypothetical protein CcCBS67573_g10570 [Chytriomyces confervae]|uniref:G-protein coupled receptors family 1 profile domain-containing protein n=1 Tax=Chytriomyces confervae TaxID=246404 RepID=A0A507CR10_9FUNG|nr:hypothetical protein CcCBS67573_g10570 [Chytriomyces confervae]
MPDPPKLTSPQFVILSACFGAVIEQSLTSMVMIVDRLRDPARKNGGTFVPTLMLLNNLFNAIYNASSIFPLYNEHSCVPMGFVCNVSAHIYFLSFDVFVLFIAHAMSNKSIWVKRASAALLLHRAGWACYDLAVSGAVWDADGQECYYYQVPESSYFPVGDILCDCFATGVITMVVFTRLTLDSNMSKALIERNFVRSITVLGANLFAVYAANNWGDSIFWLSLSVAFQSYVLARAMNFDLLFEETLNVRLNKQSTGQHIYQSVRKSSAKARASLTPSDSKT